MMPPGETWCCLRIPVSEKNSSRKLADQARSHTLRYRIGMRVYESGFPRMSLLKLSEKSRTSLQRSLTGHRNGTFSAHFGLGTSAKSMLEALLLPLFGQFLSASR